MSLDLQLSCQLARQTDEQTQSTHDKQNIIRSLTTDVLSRPIKLSFSYRLVKMLSVVAQIVIDAHKDL